jgi:hypothetical protein
LYSDYGITRGANITIQNITSLLKSSIGRKEEKKIYDMWLALLLSLDTETAGSFEKFKQNYIAGPINATKISQEQKKEMLRVVEQYEQRKGKGLDGNI